MRESIRGKLRRESIRQYCNKAWIPAPCWASSTFAGMTVKLAKSKKFMLKQHLNLKICHLLFLPAVIAELFLLIPKTRAAEILPEPPQIISRAQWGADETLRTEEPSWPVLEDGRFDPQAKVIVLHHTASATLQSDNDDSGRYTAMVRDIYRFHATSKVWYDANGAKHNGVGDICYNYLMDVNGNIYQGRVGGNGVIGAHTSGFNTGTIGVSVVGTFGGTLQGKYVDHQITLALKNSLINFVAWLAATNNIDLNQKVRFCNFKGDDCRYVYPVVGHRDLASTQCPGSSLYALIPEIRQKAADLALQYKNYLYQTPGQQAVWQLSSGVRTPFDTLAQFQQKIGAYSRLNFVPQATLSLYPLAASVIYKDGDLVRAESDSTVYWLKNQELRPILSAQVFTANNFDWSKVNVLSNLEIASFKKGSQILYPDGALVKGVADAVYLIKNGLRQHISSVTVFIKNGFIWSAILRAADNELALYPQGDDILLPNASLVKEAASPTVYYIENNSRRPISSADIFIQRKFKWSDILTLPNSELALYSLAKPLLLPDATLVKTADKSDVYIVAADKRYYVTSWQLIQDLGKKAVDIVQVSAGDLQNYVAATNVGALADWQNILTTNAQASTAAAANHAAEVSDESSLANSAVDTSPAVSASAIATSTTNQLGPNIRIGIFSLGASEDLVITGLSDFAVYKNDQVLANKKASELFTIKASDLKTTDKYRFSSSSAEPIMEIVSYEARPSWNTTLNDNQFRGVIELVYSTKSSKWWVVNELPLDQYVWGIAEITNDQAPEYLKAMTIAARSYANYHLSRGGKRAGEPYILNNTSSDQVYKGYGFEKRADKVKEAALATARKVLMFNNKPAVTAYSSDSGGTSKDACQVWGSVFCDPDYAYLRGGIKDPVATIHSATGIAASHGVGLSAVGARQMAAEGLTFDQILGKYYPGTIITDL